MKLDKTFDDVDSVVEERRLGIIEPIGVHQSLPTNTEYILCIS